MRLDKKNTGQYLQRNDRLNVKMFIEELRQKEKVIMLIQYVLKNTEMIK